MPSSTLPASGMTEVLYRAKQRGHQMSMEDLSAAIRNMGVEVEPITADDCVRAATLIFDSREARTSQNEPCLSLGDGLCLAVAERLDLPVVASDNHWASLSLNVEYLPFR